MQKIYYQLIFLTLAFIVVVLFRKVIIPKFMENWDKKIRSFINEIKIDSSSEILKDTRESSLEQIYLIEKRSDKLGFITTFVGWIELVVFMILTLLIFHETSADKVLDAVKVFGSFLGGWLAIKVLTSYGPWSDRVVGKAYYHQSLIGTLLNVTSGFLSGLFVYLAFFGL